MINLLYMLNLNSLYFKFTSSVSICIWTKFLLLKLVDSFLSLDLLMSTSRSTSIVFFLYRAHIAMRHIALRKIEIYTISKITTILKINLLLHELRYCSASLLSRHRCSHFTFGNVKIKRSLRFGESSLRQEKSIFALRVNPLYCVIWR